MSDDRGFISGAQQENYGERASSPAHQSGALAPQSEDWDDEKYGASPPVREIYDPLENATQEERQDENDGERSFSPAVQSLNSLAGETPAPHKPPQKAHIDAPLWQKLSGLYPKQEAKMTREQRREAIRRLRKEYENRIRASLGEYEREQKEAAVGRVDNPPHAEDRTFLWSPLDAICFELSIARRKLSAYMRELSGMSAQEVIDKIRAETIAARLKEILAAKAKENYEFYFQRAEAAYRKRVPPPEHPQWMLMSNKISTGQLDREKQESRARAEAGMAVILSDGWEGAAGTLLKETWESRRAQPSIAWAENSRYAARQQFARALGFSSYNRLYRACLLCFGKTVMELEHAAGLELFLESDQEAAPRREKVKDEVMKI